MSDNTLKFLLAYQEPIYILLLIIAGLTGLKVRQVQRRRRAQKRVFDFPTPPKKEP